ncbi:hypothetical protein ACMHYB_39980 [Sorangium sp. So ce1128]
MPLEAEAHVRPARGHDVALLMNIRGHDAAQRGVLLEAGVPCLILENYDHWARIYVVHLGMVTVRMSTPRGRPATIRVRFLNAVPRQGTEVNMMTGFFHTQRLVYEEPFADPPVRPTSPPVTQSSDHTWWKELLGEDLF